MTARWRKALGSALILMFVAGYVWLATVVGAHVPAVWWAQLIYYAVFGIGWGLPVIPLIAWMNRGR